MNPIIDFVYQIIELYEENQRLQGIEEDYKELRKEYFAHINENINGHKETIGMLLTETLNPDSIINKGHQKIFEEQSSEVVCLQ
jgi:hypothetical protein